MSWNQIDIRLVAKELDDKHPNLHVITLEVTDYAAFPALVKKVGKRLDYNFCEWSKLIQLLTRD